jgi:predicted Zn-dependent protease
MGTRHTRPLILLALLACACGEPATQGPAAPPPGEVHLISGQEAMRAGRYHDALDHFTQAAQAAADPYETRLWTVRARMAVGDVETAIHDAESLPNYASDVTEVLPLVIRLRLLSGDYEKAWEGIDTLAEKAPDKPDALLLKAELLLSIGFASKALEAIEAGRAKFPDRPEWDLHQAKADLLRHYVREARGGYATAAKKRGDADTHVRNAQFSYLLGEVDRAELAYIDAAVAAGDDPTPYSLAADFYAANGRYREALSDLAALKRKRGPIASVSLRIASLLVRDGHQEEAQSLLKPYLKAHQEDRTAARELALSYLREGKTTEAMATLEILSGKAIDDPLTQYLAGVARLRVNDNTRARSAFRDAERLAPGRYPARLGMAASALRGKDWYDAEYAARKLLERDPRDLHAGLMWVAARKHAGQTGAAWMIQQRLLEHHPDKAVDIRKAVALTKADKPDPVLDPPIDPLLLDEVFGK